MAPPTPANEPPRSDLLVMFGASGDLAKKKLFPAVYRLEKRGLLGIPVIGVALDDWTDDDLRAHAKASITEEGEEWDEAAFERALWDRLAAIHAIDRRRYGWDRRVSDDPASPRFSMSVGGKAFYVVGLHPAASRPARRLSRRFRSVASGCRGPDHVGSHPCGLDRSACRGA